MMSIRRSLAVSTLLSVGLCGCGSEGSAELEGASAAISPPASPLTAAPSFTGPVVLAGRQFSPPSDVAARPGVIVDLPTDIFPRRQEVPGPIVRSFAEALMRSHASCGLKAGDFQNTVGTVQRISAGTRLQSVAAVYVQAARAAHDVKVRPTGYATSSETADAKSVYIGLRRSTGAAAEPSGASVGLATQVDAKYTRDWSSRDWEEVTYSDVLTTSPEVMRELQTAEDEAFVGILFGSIRAGHVLWHEGDLAGKTWRWRWEAGDGHIDFSLADDNTFEADLYRDRSGSWTELENYSDWGGGVWRLDDGRLVVEMTHVGKSGVPGSVGHEVTWFGGGSGDAIRYVGEEAVVLANGTELRLRRP